MIDLAVPVEVVPSTDGQHLYIETEMSWLRYATMLTALKIGGVIETGFWAWSLRRRASFVRPQGVTKTAEEHDREMTGQFHGWLH